MPPPATADWQAVKTTAIATGSLIDAADHHGLKYEAVRQRASREKWPVGRRVIQQLAEAKQRAEQQVSRAAVTSITPVVTSSISSADALSSRLSRDNAATRIALSHAAKTGAEHAGKMDGKDVVKQARSIGEVGKLAALVHGWGDKASDGLQINLLCQNVENLHIKPD